MPATPSRRWTRWSAANRLPEAIARQRRIVEQSPGAPGPALRLAQLHEWNNQEREAIAVYEGLDRAGALPEPSLGRLAELYRFQDRPADLLRVADRLLARRPDDWALRDAAAQAAEGLGRFPDAVRLLQPAVERRPLDESVALRYLALTAQAGRVDDGLRVHRRFAASAGPAYRAKAGRILMDLGRYPDAVTEYEAVLAAAPGDGDDAVAARLALAQLYDWTGAGEPALRQWESLMRARPRDPRVLREVGRRSLAMSRNDVALRAYRSLLDVQPDDAEGAQARRAAHGLEPRRARGAAGARALQPREGRRLRGALPPGRALRGRPGRGARAHSSSSARSGSCPLARADPARPPLERGGRRRHTPSVTAFRSRVRRRRAPVPGPGRPDRRRARPDAARRARDRRRRRTRSRPR